MLINKLKINSYGKLKDKEIDLKNGINIIYGQNEAGKSTLINFIKNSFYGISKNKNGKDISDYDRYKPWIGEDFSGKVEYQLENGKKFEIYRDFNKKNPKIFNENMEDISKDFNIDKTKGNEFFYEQTKIDEELFLSTLAINQNEEKLEGQAQNFLIQKIANMAQTGDDNVSFKKVIDRINRRQLDEIGTERSREKPINVINREIERLKDEKEELYKYRDFRFEYEERENVLKTQIDNLELKNKLLSELKEINDNQNIDIEKSKVKEKIIEENQKKIKELSEKIDEIRINNKKILSKNYDNYSTSSKKLKVLNIIMIFVFLLNIVQYSIIENTIIKNSILITIPIAIVFYILYKNSIKKKDKNKLAKEKNELEKDKLELLSFENEKKTIENTINNLSKELEEASISITKKYNDEKEDIKVKYTEKLDRSIVNEYINLDDINDKIISIQKDINDKKLEIHSIELDKKNIEPKLDNLSAIEEKLVNYNEKMSTLVDLNLSMNLAKTVLTDLYEIMKKSVTPKFTENISTNISKITNDKYNKVMFNEEEGLIVETENGDNIPVSRLSVGTIDQLYLSLRLSMVDDLSEETIPILLDEAFAYYDDDRLKNILKFLSERFKDRQIIIFSCTEREKNILDADKINYNYYEL